MLLLCQVRDKCSPREDEGKCVTLVIVNIKRHSRTWVMRIASLLRISSRQYLLLHEYQVRYWGKKKSTIAESTEQKFSNLARSNASSI